MTMRARAVTVSVSVVARAEQGGPALADVNAEGSGCGTASFTLGGRSEPALIGGPGLITRLHALLGTKL
jgi:hypothetical protein